MKKQTLLMFSAILIGCADGQVDLLDSNGNVVGSCSAYFKYHLHGAQDSVNYILHLCAKEHISMGGKISDESILSYDYTLPDPPDGEKWNKKIAKQEFKKANISEQKYGYILAQIESELWEKTKEAKRKLSQSIISKKEYEEIVAKAKSEFEGS